MTADDRRPHCHGGDDQRSDHGGNRQPWRRLEFGEGWDLAPSPLAKERDIRDEAYRSHEQVCGPARERAYQRREADEEQESPRLNR